MPLPELVRAVVVGHWCELHHDAEWRAATGGWLTPMKGHTYRVLDNEGRPTSAVVISRRSNGNFRVRESNDGGRFDGVRRVLEVPVTAFQALIIQGAWGDTLFPVATADDGAWIASPWPAWSPVLFFRPEPACGPAGRPTDRPASAA